MPELSIIIPVYNGETYLKRCFSSVKNQKFDDFECIFINDGSTDHSEVLLKQFCEQDKRFSFYTKQNEGVSIARNFGIQKAIGKWISFIDCDDWISEEMFSFIFNTDKLDLYDVIISGIIFCNDNKNIKTCLPPNGILDFYNNELIEGWMRGPCAKLYNRNFILENNCKFPPRITMAEDFFFTFRCLYYSKRTLGIDKAFYFYYQNPFSCMHTISLEKIEDEIKVIESLENDLTYNKSTSFFEKQIFFAKELLKKKYITNISPKRFDKWRTVYPELNKRLLFRKEKITIIYWLLFFHMDKLAELFLSLKRK